MKDNIFWNMGYQKLIVVSRFNSSLLTIHSKFYVHNDIYVYLKKIKIRH